MGGGGRDQKNHRPPDILHWHFENHNDDDVDTDGGKNNNKLIAIFHVHVRGIPANSSSKKLQRLHFQPGVILSVLYSLEVQYCSHVFLAISQYLLSSN